MPATPIAPGPPDGSPKPVSATAAGLGAPPCPKIVRPTLTSPDTVLPKNAFRIALFCTPNAPARLYLSPKLTARASLCGIVGRSGAALGGDGGAAPPPPPPVNPNGGCGRIGFIHFNRASQAVRPGLPHLPFFIHEQRRISQPPTALRRVSARPGDRHAVITMRSVSVVSGILAGAASSEQRLSLVLGGRSEIRGCPRFKGPNGPVSWGSIEVGKR